MKYYVLTIYGGMEPVLSDPFINEPERNDEAEGVYDEIDPDSDAIFLLDVDEHGNVDIYPFESDEFEDEMDEDEPEDEEEDDFER